MLLGGAKIMVRVVSDGVERDRRVRPQAEFCGRGGGLARKACKVFPSMYYKITMKDFQNLPKLNLYGSLWYIIWYNNSIKC